MYGITNGVLSDHKGLQKIIHNALEEENLNIMTSKILQTKFHGCSIMVGLEDSNLILNTFPDKKSAHLYFYSRDETNGKKACKSIEQQLNPESTAPSNRYIPLGN